MKDITIIGAGIGGLTTAIALQQKGFNVRIFEQAKTIKAVGAGIILANNAMQVYEKLGLKKAIEDKGNQISALYITKANLSTISKIDLRSFERIYKVKNIAIHRGALQQLLVAQLKPDTIYLNHGLQTVKERKTGYALVFDNGKSYRATILIGADGINSVVRHQLFPNNSIRFANQICWRGVTRVDLPLQYTNALHEAWGKTERFGFVKIAKNKVYWYALKTLKNNTNTCALSNIEMYFKDYNSIIKTLISTTPKDAINTAEISDLKPTYTWFKQNACIIGDAAHATTPNLGQGACQAIEDAFVLSECLYKYDTQKAFEAFQNIRLPKAHKIVNTSWFLGKLAHLSNPILIAIRNRIMKMTPTAMNTKQSEYIFKLPKV